MHFIFNLLTGTTVTQRSVLMTPRCCLLEGVRPKPTTAYIPQDMLRQIKMLRQIEMPRKVKMLRHAETDQDANLCLDI